MAKIYEIEKELDELLTNGFTEEFVNEDGEIDEAKVAGRIEELNMNLADKLDGIACYIKDLEGDAKKIADEAKKQTERAKSLERKADSLRSYLLNYVESHGGTKIETPRNVISLQHSKACEIVNNLLIPEQFVREKIETSFDKAAILKALKASEKVPGAVLVERTSLRLK